MSIRVQELRYEEKVIGYRLSYPGMIGMSYDISIDLFDYAYKNYLMSSFINYGRSIDCIIDGDYYVSMSDLSSGGMKNRELVDELAVDGLMSRVGIVKGNGETVQTSRLVYRYLVCSRRLLDIGIPLGFIEGIVLSESKNSSWGTCILSRKSGGYTIKIFDRLLLSTGDGGVDTVVIHELLHTCKGCLNHGSLWKKWADVVCKAYGYEITRLSSAESLGSDASELINLGYYACQCMECGKIIVRKSECTFIKHPERYYCTVCGGSFVRIS